MQLDRLGVWSIDIRRTDDPEVRAAAAELERLGYGTIWYPAGSGNRTPTSVPMAICALPGTSMSTS